MFNLKNKYPNLIKEWDYLKNEDLNPENISSTKKVWWVCQKGHSWQAKITNRISGHNCVYCTHQKVNETTSLATLFPNLIKEWDYSKNENLKPENVFPNSRKKVWWICEKHGSYLCSCANKIKGKGCPFCAHIKIHLDSCLATLFPDLIKFWSKNNTLSPYVVFPNSKIKVLWFCDKEHEYLNSIAERINSFKKNNYGCPYCSGKKISKTNNLEYLYPEIAKEWDYSKNGDLLPNLITAKNGKKVWWICKNEHSWEARISNRTSINKTSCPKCFEFKREKEVRQIFEKFFNLKFPKVRPVWLINPKTNKNLELDGYNENLKLAFEYDGEYHYLPKMGDLSQLKIQQERDSIKDNLCINNKVILIRIPYTIKNLEQYIIKTLKKKDYN